MAAIESLKDEHPEANILVVVDANFPNRIARDERGQYESMLRSDALCPAPAATDGKGDGWICRIADKALHNGRAVTLVTNDSYRELQGTYPWLLDAGRVLGARPVSGVGWVTTRRSMVRARDTDRL